MKRVLFVCIGNAIRSQMAEGFARSYGFDIVSPASCGLFPATRIDPKAVQAMDDIGIDISAAFPKHYAAMSRLPFEWVVNISGEPIPEPAPARVIEWEVADPVGRAEGDYRTARDLIQKLTLGLVDQIRAAPASQNEVKVTSELKLDRRRRLRKS